MKGLICPICPILVIFGLFLIKNSDCFKAKVPNEVDKPGICPKMKPFGHKKDNVQIPSQTVESPYKIHVLPSHKKFRAGHAIDVILDAKTGFHFKGFFIQARDMADHVIGNFSQGPTTTILLSCHGDMMNAVSHNNPMKDDNFMLELVKLTWYPPKEFTGNVYFRGTFVQKFDTFWEDVRSRTIWICPKKH